MTTGSTGTRRRTLLQRGFALLAGGSAIAGGSRCAERISCDFAKFQSIDGQGHDHEK
jgi:hypothetical protein